MSVLKQGDEDGVVPPWMGDFVQRDLPAAILHKLPYEGHFSYFYLCNECHRHIFTTVFGTPGAVNENGDEERGNSEGIGQENGSALAGKDDEFELR